jgi:hypothetical protein
MSGKTRAGLLPRAMRCVSEDVAASAKTALERTAKMRGEDLSAAMAINDIRYEVALPQF